MTTRLRVLTVLAGVIAATPAFGYLLPASSILRRLASQRGEQALHAVEVRGTFVMSGEPAQAAATALGLPLPGLELSFPALLMVKTPGRCRFEIWPPNLAPSERPAVLSRLDRVAGWKGLDRVPSAAALIRGVCALLGERASGPAWAQALSRAGVSLSPVYLGRVNGRIAYVLGARPSETKPQAWIDKQTFQPLRLVAPLTGSSLFDVRLLDYGTSTGGNAFPHVVEVWEANELRARFTTEKVVANPKLPDSLF